HIPTAFSPLASPDVKEGAAVRQPFRGVRLDRPGVRRIDCGQKGDSPMSALEFIRGSLRQLHGTYRDAVAELSPDQLHWRANDNGCSIAFTLWHYYRTEDN